jgi:hypothetical protein
MTTTHTVETTCVAYLPVLHKRKNRRFRNGIVTACPEEGCNALWVSRVKHGGYGEHTWTDHFWEEVTPKPVVSTMPPIPTKIEKRFV